jgi:hypothetical protein
VVTHLIVSAFCVGWFFYCLLYYALQGKIEAEEVFQNVFLVPSFKVLRREQPTCGFARFTCKFVNCQFLFDHTIARSTNTIDPLPGWLSIPKDPLNKFTFDCMVLKPKPLVISFGSIPVPLSSTMIFKESSCCMI